MTSSAHLRAWTGLAVLFLLYQSAEGVGARLLHNGAVAAGLMVAAVLAAWPVGLWMGYKGYDAYGLDLKPISARLVLGGLLLAAAIRLAAAFWGVGTGVYSLGTATTPAGVVFLAGAAVTTFVPSIAEDIITRGFWFRASGIRWSGWTFISVTGVIYVLNHIYKLADGPTEGLRLLSFGVAYAAACWRWRNLWAAVGLHWGWNLTNAIMDGLVKFDAAKPEMATFYSIGAHVVLTALVLLWPKPDPRDGMESTAT